MNLIIASAYHVSTYYGGNEHYAHYLAAGLTTLGHQVTYLTAFYKKTKLPYRVVRLPISTFKSKPLPSLSWYKLYLRFRPDIFHVAGSGLPLLAAALGFKHHLPQIPRLLTYQADSLSYNPLMRFASLFESQAINTLFPHIIATTPTYKNMLQNRWPNSHVNFIPLFVSDIFLKSPTTSDLKKNFTSPQIKKTILFVGQLDKHHYYKGLHILIQSLQFLPPHIGLYIIGDGSDKLHYVHLAKKYAVSDRCHFAGFIDHLQLPQYFRSADCFCLPSVSASEGFGMVLIEAMTQKTPVITTTVIGSAPWFQDEKIASLVPPNHPSKLAAAIHSTLTHTPHEQILRAYHFSRQLTYQHMLNQHQNLYSTLLS